MNDDGCSVMLLGYRVILTVAEYKILNVLVESDIPLNKGALSEKTQFSASSMAVHIAHINEKAFSITRRRLIECNKNGEYEIATTM